MVIWFKQIIQPVQTTWKWFKQTSPNKTGLKTINCSQVRTIHIILINFVFLVWSFVLQT